MNKFEIVNGNETCIYNLVFGQNLDFGVNFSPFHPHAV